MSLRAPLHRLVGAVLLVLSQRLRPARPLCSIEHRNEIRMIYTILKDKEPDAWTRAQSSDKPTSMKLSKFERKAAERSRFTVEEFREFFAITPCDCGKRKCKGWHVRYKFGAERRREQV